MVGETAQCMKSLMYMHDNEHSDPQNQGEFQEEWTVHLQSLARGKDTGQTN